MSRTVLIIDDDEDARMYFKTILEGQGFEFLEAGDGVEGVEKARSEMPDLILLDLMMPKKGGLKVFNELKEDVGLQRIPVIMISGATKETGVDMKHYVFERPFHDRKVAKEGKDIETAPVEFLEKPIEPEMLRSTVSRIFGD